MTLKPIGEIELRALYALYDYDDSDFNFMSFKAIGNKGKIDKKNVRRAVRSLQRKGFAKFAIGLWSSDGEPMGSGYAITKAGEEFLQEKEEEKVNGS